MVKRRPLRKPEYTEPIGTAGDQTAPTVEIPEFTGRLMQSRLAVNEVPGCRWCEYS